MYGFLFLSVSAINGNTVKVTFNTAIDATTVLNSNFTAVNVLTSMPTTFDFAELSADGKTVTLTNNSTDLLSNTPYVLNIKGLKKVGGSDVLNFASFFTTGTDTTAPTIDSVTATTGSTTTNTVTVNFNEAVDITGAKTPVFKVNGTVVAATQAADKRSFTLQLPSGVAAGTSLQIDASNLYDFAGNTGAASKTIKVTSDLNAPTVSSVEAVSDTVLKVTFSKAVDASKLTTGLSGNVAITADGMTDAVSAIGSTTTGTSFVSGATPTVAYIVLNSGTLYPTNVGSRNLNVTFKNLTDVYGNASTKDITKTINLTKDVIKPSVVSITHKKLTSGSTSTSTFLVKLSEKATVTGTLALNLVDKDGVLTTVTGATSYVDANGNAVAGATSSDYILVSLTNNLVANSDYKVSLASGVFHDLASTFNVNDAATVSTSVTDGQGASAANAPVVTGVTQSAAGVLQVTFDKAVSVSRTLPSNYKLSGVVLPSNTNITLDGTKKIATITLPAGFVTTDNTAPVLTVSGVQSTDGGTLTSVSKSVGSTILETVAPVLTKAEYTASNTVNVTFKETTGIKAGTVVTIYNGATPVGTATTTGVIDGLTGDVDGVVNGSITEALAVTSTTLDALNQGTLTAKIAVGTLADTHNTLNAADQSVALTDSKTLVTGTLGTTYTSGTNTFAVSLTGAGKAAEAGATAFVYVAKASDVAITANNYTQFNTLTTQSAANLVSGSISFTSTVDSLGASMTGFVADNPAATPTAIVGSHVAYVVIKDAAGNVTVTSAAIN